MNLVIRRATHQDLDVCARINYEAFKGISDRHQFPTDFPTLDFATEITGLLIENSSYFDIVAEAEGTIVGYGCMDERNPIRGIGPVSVDRTFQSQGMGRKIMEALLEEGKKAPGIRLVQESFNLASLSLYISLGFEVKEPLLLVEGKFRSQPQYDFEVRPLRCEDVDECEALCNRVYGCDRTSEIQYALNHLSPLVACKVGLWPILVRCLPSVTASRKLKLICRLYSWVRLRIVPMKCFVSTYRYVLQVCFAGVCKRGCVASSP